MSKAFRHLVKERRLLLGKEALYIQGFPQELMPKPGHEVFSQKFMADLAGNAMTSSVYQAKLANQHILFGGFRYAANPLGMIVARPGGGEEEEDEEEE